eukprot:CAMPEP_0181080700 /NCGR_PEP_ID=MMETSP1071-20121207/2707_1 /TAXON_ID=35127 /ORGANISM="Thalassiosira sp., Strain NH16" /LENGTH=325 /DNA_ID=CAMNT_0023162195 /DNA_START=97 /DNA_END=1074 /DNA_ORIENTATION=-
MGDDNTADIAGELPLNRYEIRRNIGGRPKGSKNKPKSAYDPATITKRTSKNAPATPLEIYSDTSVQEYFPYLHKEYIKLSNRSMNIPGHPVPKKEGEHCTTIMDANFTLPLAPFGDDEKPKIPFDNNSWINQFHVFMMNMFQACESGSIGGDSCRMEDVLCAAAEDIFMQDEYMFAGMRPTYVKSAQERIEHLLGLTMAMVRHEMHALLDRGNPERLELVLGDIAKEWKKFFEPGKNITVYNVSDDVREFAKDYCGALQLMLKSTDKTHGKGTPKYKFNYIRIPRPAQSRALLAKKRKTTNLTEEKATSLENIENGKSARVAKKL